MRIGIDASRAATAQRTGTEAYAYHLIRALMPLAIARSHSLTLYYNQPPETSISDVAHDARVLTFPRLWTHLRLAADLHQHPPDVFFTPAHVIPLSYRRPSVATIHDLGYHYFPEAHGKRQVRQLTWSTRHNARRSRLIVADSDATKADLGRFYGISAEKIRVIYPGFDTTLAPVRDTSALQTRFTKYDIEQPYFLFLSTLQPRKNVARLVSAFASVADSLPQQLVLAGKQGWLAQPFLEQINALPAEIRQRIRLIGFVDDADKAALLSGATALVYPSLHEGFGFPVLEAQACETPVLTARNSSLAEVGADSVCAVSAESIPDIAAAMQRLANDEAYRNRLVKAGLDNIKRFSWQQAAQQVLTVLEAAAGRQP